MTTQSDATMKRLLLAAVFACVAGTAVVSQYVPAVVSAQSRSTSVDAR